MNVYHRHSSNKLASIECDSSIDNPLMCVCMLRVTHVSNGTLQIFKAESHDSFSTISLHRAHQKYIFNGEQVEKNAL